MHWVQLSNVLTQSCLCPPVTSFAKKTGDYHGLSSVDLKVMALTYQLECELGHERGANLRTKPLLNSVRTV